MNEGYVEGERREMNKRHQCGGLEAPENGHYKSGEKEKGNFKANILISLMLEFNNFYTHAALIFLFFEFNT